MQIGYIESTKYKLSNADRAFLEILKAAVRHSLQDESFAVSINDCRFQTKMNSSPAQVSCVGLLFFYALYSPLICSASRAPSRT